MKKKLTIFFVFVMVFVMLFTIIGCDNKNDQDENKDGSQIVEENPDEGNGDTDQGEENPPEEPVSTAVSDSVLINDAFANIIGADGVYISIPEFTFSMGGNESSELDGTDVDANIDVYLRKAEKGYDLGLTMSVLLEEEAVDKNTDEKYIEKNAIGINLIYKDGYMYTVIKDVLQSIVDGVGYESYDDYKADPSKADAALIENIITDWDNVDEFLGNTGEESRVSVSDSMSIANSLDSLISQLNEIAPITKELGLATPEAFLNIISRAVESAAQLATGETEAEENGNRIISVSIQPKEIFNKYTKILSDNIENTLGVLVEKLVDKDQAYIEGVIDALFPAEGKCLTINQFIDEVEKILAENGIDITFKEIVDEVQEISGFSSQQIADVLNMLLEKELPSSIAISINPEEGETIYDTLENTAFKMLGVDTILGLIFSEGEGETSGETGSALTSATLNAKVKEALFDEENGMTFMDLMSKHEILEVLSMMTMYQADEATLDLTFTLDGENRLIGVEIGMNTAVSMLLPDEALEELPEGYEGPEMFFKADGKIVIEYGNFDEKFNTFVIEKHTATYTLENEIDTTTIIYCDKCMEACGITVGEDDEFRFDRVMLVAENGYVTRFKEVWESTTLDFNKVPSDYEKMYFVVTNNENEWYFIEVLPPATQTAPEA